MNVFILTEGGKDAGLGHITRCISIYQAFEKVGIQAKLIVNGDEAVQDLLKYKNFRLFLIGCMTERALCCHKKRRYCFYRFVPCRL